MERCFTGHHSQNEELVRNVTGKGCLGCSDHEMVEFKILRAEKRAYNKPSTLDFRRAGLGLFRNLLARVPSRDQVRVAKTQSELHLSRYIKDNKKGSYKYIGDKRKTRENVGPLLMKTGELVAQDMGKFFCFSVH